MKVSLDWSLFRNILLKVEVCRSTVGGERARVEPFPARLSSAALPLSSLAHNWIALANGGKEKRGSEGMNT